MKVSARRLDQEKGPLASGHEGRACLRELKKFMRARKPELPQQGKEKAKLGFPHCPSVLITLCFRSLLAPRDCTCLNYCG